MMVIRKVALGDIPTSLWANGKGVTRVLDVLPHGATMDSFEWRVSMACVAGDGPFSVLPGVRRSLAVVAGPYRMRLEGRQPVKVEGASNSTSWQTVLQVTDDNGFDFDGADAVKASLEHENVGDDAFRNTTLLDSISSSSSSSAGSGARVLLDFNAMHRTKEGCTSRDIQGAPTRVSRITIVKLRPNGGDVGTLALGPYRRVVVVVACGCAVMGIVHRRTEDAENTTAEVEEDRMVLHTGDVVTVAAPPSLSTAVLWGLKFAHEPAQRESVSVYIASLM